MTVARIGVIVVTVIAAITIIAIGGRTRTPESATITVPHSLHARRPLRLASRTCCRTHSRTRPSRDSNLLYRMTRTALLCTAVLRGLTLLILDPGLLGPLRMNTHQDSGPLQMGIHKTRYSLVPDVICILLHLDISILVRVRDTDLLILFEGRMADV
jgi:hypothetical protein